MTAAAARLLGAAPIEGMALLGAGALARCHLELLPCRLSDLRAIRLYDLDGVRAAALAGDLGGVTVCASAEEAVRGARLVIAVTTARSGYIRHDRLEPGALLVKSPSTTPCPRSSCAPTGSSSTTGRSSPRTRRLLGAMLRAGRIRGPNGAAGGARAIDGELGELLTGARGGRARPEEIILVNPFGLAIGDIAVARRVYRRASALGLGTMLER